QNCVFAACRAYALHIAMQYPIRRNGEPQKYHDEGTAGLLMKIIEKLVSTGSERPNIHCARGTWPDHLLDAQRYALKFYWRTIGVLDADGDRPVRWRAQFGWLETMILHRDRKGRTFLGDPVFDWQ